jgi:hypothetical protein
MFRSNKCSDMFKFYFSEIIRFQKTEKTTETKEETKKKEILPDPGPRPSRVGFGSSHARLINRGPERRTGFHVSVFLGLRRATGWRLRCDAI